MLTAMLPQETFDKLAASAGCGEGGLDEILNIVKCLQGVDRDTKNDLALAIQINGLCNDKGGAMSFNFRGAGAAVALGEFSPSVKVPFPQEVIGWEFNAFDGADASVVDTAQITVETAPPDDPDTWTTLLVADLTAASSDVAADLSHTIEAGRYVRARITTAPATAQKLDLHLLVK